MYMRTKERNEHKWEMQMNCQKPLGHAWQWNRTEGRRDGGTEGRRDGENSADFLNILNEIPEFAVFLLFSVKFFRRPHENARLKPVTP
jgi:hypothetical protein